MDDKSIITTKIREYIQAKSKNELIPTRQMRISTNQMSYAKTTIPYTNQPTLSCIFKPTWVANQKANSKAKAYSP